MKTINVRDLQKNIRACVEGAQDERVVITRNGKPVLVLIGVEGQEWGDIALQTSSSFWKMIAERRNQKTISGKALRKRLGLNATPQKKQQG